MRALPSVVLQRPSEAGIGLSLGIRTAAWLLAVVLVVAMLALYGRASGVSNNLAIRATTQSASGEVAPQGSYVPSWILSALLRRDAPDDANVFSRSAPANAQEGAAAPSGNPAAAESRATPYRLASLGDTSSRATSYGLASYYGNDSHTASGEKFNARAFTAAHRTLPLGTRVRVTELATGRSVMVRINDRGPFVPGRIIDVSTAAAESLGMVGRGVTRVRVDVVE